MNMNKNNSVFSKILNNRGFSLIEILVASAIASLIMTMIYTAYRSTLTSIKDMTGYAEMYENINLAISKIDRDLTNTFIKKTSKQICFICELDADNSKLNFVTVDYQNFHILGDLKTPFPYSDIHEVGYYLKQDKEYPGMYFLVKRDESHYDDDPVAGGKENILLENVIGLNFKFKSGNDWIDTWDSRETSRYPQTIKTTIKVKKFGVDINDTENIEEFVFISFININ